MVKRSGGLTPQDRAKFVDSIVEGNKSLISRFAWEFGRHQRYNTPTAERDYSRFVNALDDAIREHLKFFPNIARKTSS